MKNNKKGFTLAELLVVVAIIGILVAVSIPVFTSQLEKARESTDVANMRAAKAAAVVKYLSDGDNITYTSGKATYYYDAAAGTLVASAPTTEYGKGTKTVGTISYDGYDNAADYTKSVIKIEITETTGAVAITWDPTPTK